MIFFQVRTPGSPTSSSSAAFLYNSDPLGSPPPAHMGGIPYSLDPSKGELANISFSFSFLDCLKGTEIMAFSSNFCPIQTNLSGNTVWTLVNSKCKRYPHLRLGHFKWWKKIVILPQYFFRQYLLVRKERKKKLISSFAAFHVIPFLWFSKSLNWPVAQ